MTALKALAVNAGLVLVLVVDLVAAVRVVMPPEGSFAGAVGAHAACSIAAGALLADAAPPFLTARRTTVALFVACVAFFVPVLGLAGVLAVLGIGLSEPRSESAEPWLVHEPIAELDAQRRRRVRSLRRRTSAPEIMSALRRRSPEHAADRFRAVLATKRLPSKLAVPLLKLAQRDPSDEVRLYAFSRLENMRDDIERRIDRLRAAVGEAAEGAQAILHLRLAESYWELGTSGLTEGAVRGHAVASAHGHARSACELSPSYAPAELLRGRALLQLRDPSGAGAAFEAAMRAGYPRSKVLIDVAECAFQRRDFAAVRAVIAELDASPQDSADVRDIIALWTQGDAARPANRPPAALTEQTI